MRKTRKPAQSCRNGWQRADAGARAEADCRALTHALAGFNAHPNPAAILAHPVPDETWSNPLSVPNPFLTPNPRWKASAAPRRKLFASMDAHPAPGIFSKKGATRA